MILSRDAIEAAIKAGRLVIEPFFSDCVGPCSIDLHLGNKFRRLKKVRSVAISEHTHVKDLSELIKLRDGEELELRPGEFVLGCTLERIRLDDSLCARIDGRSRFGRLGLLVHISSSLVQPGVDGVQILEIMNMAPFIVRLKPGVRICQLVVEELRGRARYEGEFRHQQEP